MPSWPVIGSVGWSFPQPVVLRNSLRPHVTLLKPTVPVYLRSSRHHTMSDSASQPPDTKMEVTNDLDQSVENEINQDATQTDAMNLDGANDDAPTANGLPEVAATFEQRIPAKKDATLREFLGKMDEYAPIVSATAVGGVDHTADADLDT
jgi:hypothetical protein